MNIHSTRFAGTFSNLTVEHPTGQAILKQSSGYTSMGAGGRRAAQPQAGNIDSTAFSQLVERKVVDNGLQATLTSKPGQTVETWGDDEPEAITFSTANLVVSGKDGSKVQKADDALKAELTKEGVKFDYTA